jgi:hypothetical protein
VASKTRPRAAADIVTALMRAGWWQTAARPALAIPSVCAPFSADIAHRGAEYARRLLADAGRRRA